jgi:hypothetical protein
MLGNKLIEDVKDSENYKTIEKLKMTQVNRR